MKMTIRNIFSKHSRCKTISYQDALLFAEADDFYYPDICPLKASARTLARIYQKDEEQVTQDILALAAQREVY